MRRLRIFGLVIVMLLTNGCVGLHGGAFYDHAQHALKPMIGVTIEGFGDTDTKRPTFGAASRVLYPVGGKARVSLQPEANLPIGPELGNLTVAAGIASGPTAFQGTLCYRRLDVVSYGSCGHWYSDGSVGVDLNVSLFAALLLIDLTHLH